MHALFFEMRPKPGHLDHYFDHVDRLRPSLAAQEGLLFLDRYGSMTDPGLLMSHQLWESEEAIISWRKDAQHRKSQAAGNNQHFANYRIRVGARFLHRQPGVAKDDILAEPMPNQTCVLALYGTKPVLSPMFAAFKSFNHDDRYLSLASFGCLAEFDAAMAGAGDQQDIDEVSAYGIRRDYGQFDRAQAPQ